MLAASGSTTFTEGNNTASVPVAVAPAITVADADHAELATATVSITSSPAAGEDHLRFTDTAAITGSYDTATDVLTLTGPASKADWATALRSVTYANDGETPTAGDRTVRFEASDGAKTSSPVTRTVSVVAVDDTPTLTGPASVSWTEADNAASTPVSIGADTDVADRDSATMASATVAISSGYRSGEDVLAYAPDDDSGNVLAASNAGGVLTLTSSGATATKAQWAHALSRVTYDNSSDTPNETARTVRIVVNDGTSASAANTRTLQVAGVDDTPVATASPGAVAWTEADNAVPAPVAVDDALAVSDLDSANLASATVAITAAWRRTRMSSPSRPRTGSPATTTTAP